MEGLLPHGKKEAKIEKHDKWEDIEDLCLSHTCSNVLYFESKRKKDLSLFVAKYPDGPSIKF